MPPEMVPSLINPKNNVWNAKQQVAEMMAYAQIRKQQGSQLPPDELCKEWVRRYAALFRELANSGVDNPSGILKQHYLTESLHYRPSRMVSRRTLADRLNLLVI